MNDYKTLRNLFNDLNPEPDTLFTSDAKKSFDIEWMIQTTISPTLNPILYDTGVEIITNIVLQKINILKTQLST